MRKTSTIKEDCGEHDHSNHDRFKGLVKFPSTYCTKLANVLCKDERMVQNYITNYYNPEYEQYEVIDRLHEYRKDIKNQRENVNGYEDKISTCIENGDCKSLREVLQELFLEHLEMVQVESIFAMIHSGLNECDIMKWYNKGKGILKMTTFRVEYIKGL